MPRMLAIWFPRWPIQRLGSARLSRSSLPGMPRSPVGRWQEAGGRNGYRQLPPAYCLLPTDVLLAVYEGPRRGGYVIAACSAAAARRSIRPGMPVAEATTLAPNLHLEPHNPAADRRQLELLAQMCESFSPSVGLEEAERPECLLLDITGLEPLLGDEATLAEQALRFLADQGFFVRAAIADTPAAAWAAAHYLSEVRVAGVERSEPPALGHWGLAALDPSHPCVCIPPGETLAALAKLPVAALRLGPATLTLLAELGLERIEQVLALPRASLASRFEPELVRRLDQLTGAVPERIDAVRPPPEIAVEQALETPTGRRDVVEMILEQLIARTVEQLSARRRGAVRVECELTCQGGLWDGAALRPTVRLRLGLYRPTAERRHLLELVRMRLERTVLAGPVSAVRLTVPLAAPLVARQLALGELLTDEPQAPIRGS